jgi:hypothetical protein
MVRSMDDPDPVAKVELMNESGGNCAGPSSGFATLSRTTPYKYVSHSARARLRIRLELFKDSLLMYL